MDKMNERLFAAAWNVRRSMEHSEKQGLCRFTCGWNPHIWHGGKRPLSRPDESFKICILPRAVVPKKDSADLGNVASASTRSEVMNPAGAVGELIEFDVVQPAGVRERNDDHLRKREVFSGVKYCGCTGTGVCC